MMGCPAQAGSCQRWIVAAPCRGAPDCRSWAIWSRAPYSAATSPRMGRKEGTWHTGHRRCTRAPPVESVTLSQIRLGTMTLESISTTSAKLGLFTALRGEGHIRWQGPVRGPLPSPAGTREHRRRGGSVRAVRGELYGTQVIAGPRAARLGLRGGRHLTPDPRCCAVAVEPEPGRSRLVGHRHRTRQTAEPGTDVLIGRGQSGLEQLARDAIDRCSDDRPACTSSPTLVRSVNTGASHNCRIGRAGSPCSVTHESCA